VLFQEPEDYSEEDFEENPEMKTPEEYNPMNDPLFGQGQIFSFTEDDFDTLAKLQLIQQSNPEQHQRLMRIINELS
jgi:hypothetical protein